MKISQVALSCLLLTAVIVSCGGCGDDPVKPVDPPRIAEFTAQPTDIMPGDSTLLSYRIVGAEIVSLSPGPGNLSSTTGSIYVSPAVPTEYSLVAVNDGGRDSASVLITMSGAVASLTIFDITPENILIGDSLTLTWRTERADSVVISENQSRLLGSTVDSGQVMRSPSVNTSYTAVAFNDIGNDTVSVATVVEVPFAVDAVFGTLFKGTMGNGILDPAFRFRVLDASNQALKLPWLYFSIVEGDGYLLADSAQPDGNGSIWNDYIFDGSLGHAVIRATVPDVDTLEVRARASVLRLGPGGQGQYIRFEDTYADVVALNGTPDSVNVDPDRWINYAVYETGLGVVVPIEDLNQNEQVDADEPVLEVFVNTVFAPQTLAGIGIGSTIHEVRAVYDPIYDSADYHFYDATPPATEAFVYESLGAIFYALASAGADSAIVEIHLWEPILPGTAPAEVKIKAGGISAQAQTIEQYRRR